ncbi:MAG: Gfo/Idh/MocA family oxidoreductase [Bryobacteraceae bacterium]|nr:Gfo/Idh/MocA family oxidoreductase [Bryobacteraceae bacterium]
MTRRTAIALTTAASSAANSALNVGLLGTGNRGPFVAGLMGKHTTARIAALCDLSEERMAKAKQQIGVENPRLYTDFRQMLASDIDAIIIATPVFLHVEHFEAAVKAGKHIYLEKPASVDVAGCKRIMALADSADRKLNITFGFQRRYAELYRKGKQLADSGAIGAIRLGHAKFIKSEGQRAQPTPKPRTAREKAEQWGAWKELSGDLIVENNIHSIDVLNWFLGARPISAIGAGGTTIPAKGDSRDHNFVAYEYPGGVQGQLNGTTLAPPGYREVSELFYGEKGLIETSENFLRHFKGPGQETIEKTPRNLTIDAVAEFVRRINEGKPENTAVRGAESTLTAILGRMAMDARREVTWAEMMKS